MTAIRGRIALAPARILRQSYSYFKILSRFILSASKKASQPGKYGNCCFKLWLSLLQKEIQSETTEDSNYLHLLTLKSKQAVLACQRGHAGYKERGTSQAPRRKTFAKEQAEGDRSLGVLWLRARLPSLSHGPGGTWGLGRGGSTQGCRHQSPKSWKTSLSPRRTALSCLASGPRASALGNSCLIPLIHVLGQHHPLLLQACSSQ